MRFQVTLDGVVYVMGGYDGVYRNDVWGSLDHGVTWTAEANAGWSARRDFVLLTWGLKIVVRGDHGPTSGGGIG